MSAPASWPSADPGGVPLLTVELRSGEALDLALPNCVLRVVARRGSSWLERIRAVRSEVAALATETRGLECRGWLADADEDLEQAEADERETLAKAGGAR